MNRIITLSLAVAAAFSAAQAQSKVLLNEDFSSVSVVYEDHYAPMKADWTVATDPAANPMPYTWCVYAAGKSDQTDNAAFVDASTLYGYENFTSVLYTPALVLDDTYRIQFSWKSSPMALNSNCTYDFVVKVVEDGKTADEGTTIFDFKDADMLLHSGVNPTSWGALWEGWKEYISTLSLAQWKGKTVKVAFCYKAYGQMVNSVEVDDIKVEQFVEAASPIMSTSVSEWRFGDVYIGAKMKSDIITITNTGVGQLQITGVDAPEGFGVAFDRDMADVNLKKNETMQMQLFYEPSLTSPASGNIVFHTNGPDASIAVTASKKMLSESSTFEGFEGEQFPPAGWYAKDWKRVNQGIEGDYSAYPSGYYGSQAILRTPRIDASSSPATIEFSYCDVYNGEELGSDCTVKLQFSKDGGNTWETVDTYDYNDTYDEIFRKTFSREANSDNCYWQWVWTLDYYDTETGAEVSFFYLDAVVLNNIYGAGGTPAATTATSPENGAKNVYTRTVTLAWNAAQFATGYKLYVGTDNAASNIVNGQDMGSSLSYELTNLNYATEYSWKVVPFNSKGEAADCPVWKFTTLSDPTISAIPYAEGFDNGVPPLGWYTEGTGYTRWSDNQISPYDGTASAMASARGDNESCILETPPFVLSDDAILSFYWGDGVAVSLQKDETGMAKNTATKSDGIADMLFQVSVDGGEYSTLAILSDKNNPYWLRERFDLSAYTGHTVTFRWLYTCHNYFKAPGGACIDAFAVQPKAEVKLSFNVADWTIGKVNCNEVFTSNTAFSLLNDGSAEAEIKSVEFSSPIFSTSLQAGTKIATGSGVPFTITVDAAKGQAGSADATMTVTATNGSKAELPIYGEVLTADTRFYGFEHDEFGTTSPADFITIDVDRKPTIALSMVDYPHKSEQMAFVVMNYKKADWSNPYPNTGDQQLVTFGAYDYGSVEDWLISTTMTATEQSKFDFWARSYEHKDALGGALVWGQANAAVMVSPTGSAEKDDFELVKNFTVEAPDAENYFNYSVDLSKYAGKTIRVAIKHTVTDGLAYFYDDLTFSGFSEFSGIGSVANDSAEGARVEGTDIVVSEAADIVVYNTAGQKVAAAMGATSVSAAHLPAGVYIVTTSSAKGSKVQRLMKH